MTESWETEMRAPRRSDAAAIWRLVRESESLEANSLYAYLLICRDFPDTSLVAHDPRGLVGFVSAYRPPRNPTALFVWQIGVDRRARRRGLARAMLTRLLNFAGCRGVVRLEATVEAGNRPSQALFRSLAASLGAPLRVLPGFSEADFGDQPHEAEQLLVIEPLPPAESMKP